MSNKQARLVAAVADTMAAKSISQSTLARKSGVAQSMISAAILGKYDLKEEKWRLICEALELDYDDIIADAEPSETEEEATPSPDIGGVRPFPLVKNRNPRKIWPSMTRSADDMRSGYARRAIAIVYNRRAKPATDGTSGAGR